MDASKLRAFRKAARKARLAKTPDEKAGFSQKLSELAKGMAPEQKKKYSEKYSITLA